MFSQQLRRDLTLLAAGAGLVGLGYSIAHVRAEGVPGTQPLMYSGTIEEDGVAPTGERAVTAQLWDAPERGSQLCPEVTRTVPVSQGRFRLEISDECTEELRANPDAWVQIAFKDASGETRRVARAKVGAVPFAFEADHALTANDATTAKQAMHALSAEQASGELQGTLESGKQLLPWAQPKVVQISNTQMDLGDQLAALLSAYRSIEVNLAANRTYKWNTAVEIMPFQELVIRGEGYENPAANITVKLLMDQAKPWKIESTVHRAPARVVVQGGRLELLGVNIEMPVVDNAPMSPLSNQGALFVNSINDGEIVLQQIRISSTENVVNLSEWAYGRVKFGHTYIDKHPSSPRDIFAVTANSGWGFTGHGGVVSNTYLNLGPGVTIEQTPRIRLLD